MTGTVHQLNPKTPTQYAGSNNGNGGNGKEIHGRLVAIETEMKHLATKTDMQKLETAIKSSETSMLKWFVGIVVIVVVAFVAIIFEISP
ncbi:MAG: hypothetical protein OXF95_00025 [Rhodobacteraceae bacterium]|nr:hypothetical protein [Paracoccaceae bacterium]